MSQYSYNYFRPFGEISYDRTFLCILILFSHAVTEVTALDITYDTHEVIYYNFVKEKKEFYLHFHNK